MHLYLHLCLYMHICEYVCVVVVVVGCACMLLLCVNNVTVNMQNIRSALVLQLISKVYLKKHTSQPHTHNLNKKDAKMVKDTVAKKH